MRILIVDTCYSAFLSSHYSAHPGLADEPYETQWGSLMATHFGTADAYSHHLSAVGHEAHEVVVNCRPLQAAWAREHGTRLSRIGLRHRGWQQAAVLSQARAFEPDVVYVQNLSVLTRRTLERLKSLSRLVVGQIASEPPPTAQLRAFDLILTSFPHFVERFRALGVASEYLRIGFDRRVLDRLTKEKAPFGDREAVFVGALNRTQHSGGNMLLERAAQREPIEFWGYRVEDWPEDSAIRRGYRGEAWGIDMFRVLRSARIAVNRHIEVAESFANNMRLYEATGVGSMLLTDAKDNLSELFVPGQEVETYASEDELVEKIRHYRADEDARARIARQGQERTLRDHTYQERMTELSMILDQYL
jgi:hypothetical protein